jgi:capsule polysaccharide export protein KpsC/LpsZ
MARAVERTEPTMNAQGTANILDALSKLDAVVSAMSLAGWDAVVRAAERMAPTMW